ncbi:MAG: sugar phosphate isomerase/epimerase [Verrucomicrobiales bacterium]|jgi:sugar phosphate isomerase/epimerase
MLSFSTCWNSSRHTDGEVLVREILDMGFDTIEISHGLSVSLLPGIKQAYDRLGFKVSGLHNFCPSPVEVMIDAPDCYEFTSHRPYERERAVSLTLKTLEYARQFDASYVVLHMGSVPMKKMSKELTTMVKEGKLNSRDYVKLKLKTIKMREKLAPLYVKRSKAALTVIAEKAEEVGIPVAVESRSRYEDVPSEREMIEIMEEFKDNPFVGYWHDFGHVQLKANLSMLSHFEWLKTMQPYLIGCHLHDVQWPARDHQVPLTGTIQYDKLIPLVDPAKPMVWELSPRRKKEQILECLPKWIERYGP